MTFILLFLGFLVGSIIIAMGGGGGAFYLWILTSVAGVSVASATATSLFTALPALLVGVYSQYKTGNIHFKIGTRMTVSAIPTIFIGSWVAHFLPQRIYSIIIGIVFAVMGAKLLSRSFNNSNQKGHYSPIQAYAYGALSGMLVGIAGLSGGGAMVSGLLLMGLSMPEAAATSSYALVATTVIGMIAHITQSNIAWVPGLLIMLGAIIGSAITPRLMARFDKRKVTKIFSPIMAIIMLIMAMTYIF